MEVGIETGKINKNMRLKKRIQEAPHWTWEFRAGVAISCHMGLCKRVRFLHIVSNASAIFSRAHALTVPLDLRPESLACRFRQKYRFFKFNFCCIVLKFSEHSLRYEFCSPKYFHFFFLNRGSSNVGSKHSMDRSRGCIATSDMPFSNIAELQHLHRFSGESKEAKP